MPRGLTQLLASGRRDAWKADLCLQVDRARRLRRDRTGTNAAAALTTSPVAALAGAVIAWSLQYLGHDVLMCHAWAHSLSGHVPAVQERSQLTANKATTWSSQWPTIASAQALPIEPLLPACPTVGAPQVQRDSVAGACFFRFPKHR